MGAGTSAKNIPNAPKIFNPICLPKPKCLGFSKSPLLPLAAFAILEYTLVNFDPTKVTKDL